LGLKDGNTENFSKLNVKWVLGGMHMDHMTPSVSAIVWV